MNNTDKLFYLGLGIALISIVIVWFLGLEELGASVFILGFVLMIVIGVWSLFKGREYFLSIGTALCALAFIPQVPDYTFYIGMIFLIAGFFKRIYRYKDLDEDDKNVI